MRGLLDTNILAVRNTDDFKHLTGLVGVERR